VYNAARGSRRLGKLEERVDRAIEDLCTIMVEHEELPAEKRRSVLIRLENVLMAVEDAFKGAENLWDPDASAQLLEDVREYRRAVEAEC
jgi:FtsZ-binding cell division protein ZapB